MTQPPESGSDNPSDQPTPDSSGSEGQQVPAATPQWPSPPPPGPGENVPGSTDAPGYAGQPGQASQPEYPAYPPYPPPPAYGPTPQTSNNAVAALVLSIVSWVFCPIIPAIIALVFASKARREILASNGWVTGTGLVTSAKIVAWINIGFWAAMTIVWIFILVIALISGAINTS
ncbi:MAG: DUF4190 domain-containing protein [Actinomycetales bacterium]|nr:DUF4190 domain-containing protein [Actinomycetales bacterium]MCP4894711.1 DUF4190 domain-containing protein [Actinomycetales bacterium]